MRNRPVPNAQWAGTQCAMGRYPNSPPKSRNMLLYKREVLGGALPLWIPMDPYRGSGALKAPAPLEIPTINPAARSASEPNPRRLGLPMPARVGAVSRIRPVRCPALLTRDTAPSA